MSETNSPSEAPNLPASPPDGVAEGAPDSAAEGEEANKEVAAQWNCKPQKYLGDLTAPLTVGEKFLLTCEGSPVSLDQKSLRIELSNDAKFTLRILETRHLSETSAEFVAVTWVAADHKFSNPILTDGKSRVALGQFEVSAKTVIDPQANPENQPYPPWGPQAMSWPLYMWAVVAALLLMLAVSLTLAIRQTMRRRRLLAELKKNASALTPFNQFNKDLRRILRQMPLGQAKWTAELSKKHFDELNSAFRWFLARELIIPALRAKPSSVVRSLKRTDKVIYKEVKRELYVALSEIDQAIRSKNGVPIEDAHQIAELCRRLADQITKMRNTGPTSGSRSAS